MANAWLARAKGDTMHAVSFMLKQAHLKDVALGTRKLKDAGLLAMTPARFNLMVVLRRGVMVPGWKRLDPARLQSSLWKDLGLHRSTVAKMLKRLEEMGWIWREKAVDDGRDRVVGLTELGLGMIGLAMERTFWEKVMRNAYERVFKMPRETRNVEGDIEWQEERALEKLARKAEEKIDRAPEPPRGPLPEVIAMFAAYRSPPQGAARPVDVVDAIHEAYWTIRHVARCLGDTSNLWFHIGKGLPAHD